jgi:putative redox protein
VAHIDLTWVAEKRFLGVDSTGHSVVLSAPGDIGVKPSETLLLALAACSAYDVVEIVAKRRAALRSLEIHVTAEQAEQPPWAFTRIHLAYSVAAEGLAQEQLERAVDLALNKYCSVRASLAPSIVVTFEARLS